MQEEKPKKTTIDIPPDLAAVLLPRLYEKKISGAKISMGSIVTKTLRIWLRSDLSWDESKKKALWTFQLSDDPEDLIEVELSIDLLKLHFVSLAQTLQKQGVDIQKLLEGKR